MKVLFLSRAYPPVVGGLENQNFNLARSLVDEHPDCRILANRRGKRMLPLFLPWALAAGFWSIRRHGLEHLHLGDGVLAPVGWLLKRLTGVTTSVTIHGLDITYDRPLYQRVVPFFLRRLDKVIPVSRASLAQCVARGITPDRCVIIPNGVPAREFAPPQAKAVSRQRLSEHLGRDLSGVTIMLTVGRLVRRKGVQWFLTNVMPLLDRRYFYMVVGDGPQMSAIRLAAAVPDLRGRVVLVGKVSDGLLKLFYHCADIMVLPNQPVDGDMEGFGIVALEAAASGLPVVASDLEGLADAVLPGQTGVLVPPTDAAGFAKAIASCRLDPRNMMAAAAKHFDWKVIAGRYWQEFLSCHARDRESV